MQVWQTQSLITLAITAFVVLRFVRRELTARVVRNRTLWFRPGLLLVLLALSVFATLQQSHGAVGLLALAVVVGGMCGAVTGVLVVRSTTFTPVGALGAVRVHGSWLTAGIWIGAILLRPIGRILVPHAGQGQQLALNSGLIALAAVAFAIVAIAFAQAIRRLSGAPDAQAPAGAEPA